MKKVKYLLGVISILVITTIILFQFEVIPQTNSPSKTKLQQQTPISISKLEQQRQKALEDEKYFHLTKDKEIFHFFQSEEEESRIYDVILPPKLEKCTKTEVLFQIKDGTINKRNGAPRRENLYVKIECSAESGDGEDSFGVSFTKYLPALPLPLSNSSFSFLFVIL